jgi:hypothetical protein
MHALSKFKRLFNLGWRDQLCSSRKGYEKLLEDCMDNDTPRDQLEAPPKYVTPCEELEERNTWLRTVGFYLFHILYNSIERNADLS